MTTTYGKRYKRHVSLPWYCYFCGEEILEIGRGKHAIHHLDGDHSNNELENLTASHQSCHGSFHLKGRNITWGDKISEAKRGKARFR